MYHPILGEQLHMFKRFVCFSAVPLAAGSAGHGEPGAIATCRRTAAAATRTRQFACCIWHHLGQARATRDLRMPDRGHAAQLLAGDG